MSLTSKTPRISLQLALEAKYINVGEECFRLGPLEFAIGPGGGIQIAVETTLALRALREILCFRDLNWLGHIVLCGADGRGLPVSELFASEVLGELSDDALSPDESARQILAPAMARFTQKSLPHLGFEQIVASFGLDAVAHIPSSKLSSIHRQRLNLAFLCLARPRVILVDCSRPLHHENRALVQESLIEMSSAGSALVMLEGTAEPWDLLHVPRVRLPIGAEGRLGARRGRGDEDDDEWLRRLELEAARGAQPRATPRPGSYSWARGMGFPAPAPLPGVGKRRP